MSSWKQPPVVDEGRVAQLLRGITECHGRLRSARELPTEQRSGLWLDGVKYLFITAIQDCIDVAQHVVSSESFSAPDTNADAIQELGRRDVVDAQLASDLSLAVGFATSSSINTQPSMTRVFDALDGLAQFDDFVAQVSRWVVPQP